MELHRIFESFPRMRHVRKDWGYEIWFFNTAELCMKLLVVNPGWTCSYHEHPRKYEIFYILDSDDAGRVFMTVDGEDKAMHPGDHEIIERNTPHEFCVRGDKPGAFLEFSTQHRDDDSVRHTVSRLLSLGQKGHSFMGELAAFSDVKVLAVGDIMHDIYWSGPTRGLSPEAPVANVYPNSIWDDSRPGGMGNVASNVLSLGGQCVCVGCVGMDSFGQLVTDMLKSEGAEVSYMMASDKIPTTTKVRIMTGAHHHCRVNFENENEYDEQLADDVYDNYRNAVLMEQPDVIYFADYDKGLLNPRFVFSAMRLAKEKGIPTIIDPKLAHPWGFIGATLYKPNVGRLATTLGRPLDTESDISWAAEQIYERIKPEAILITRGSFGMTLFAGPECSNTVHIPGQTVNVWELSGAGDTVGAVMALCMGAGIGIERSARIGNAAGSLIVQRAGTSTLTQSELLAAL